MVEIYEPTFEEEHAAYDEEWQPIFRAIIKDYCDRLELAGYVIVPKEPTGAMKDAGANSYGVPTPAIGSLPLSVIDGQPTKAWHAMIAAAPAPNLPEDAGSVSIYFGGPKQ